jgi:hypothetical protein
MTTDTVEIKKFEVTYHKEPKHSFNVEFDETFLHVVEGYEHEDAMENFESLNLGTLWSIDELKMHQSSFTTKHSAEAFLACHNKYSLGHVEEKGSYNFVVHYASCY